MKVRARKHKNGEGRLVSVANSIGSTMGRIASRVNAVQRAVTRSAPVARTANRRGKTVVRNTRRGKNATPAGLNRVKRAGAARRGLRRKNLSAKRGVRG
jgi:uncharacterized protein YggE